MQDALREWAAARGYRVAWFGGSGLRGAFDRIKGLRDEGAFEPAFFESLLAWMTKPDLRAQAGAASVIVVAVPRPAHVVTFADRDGRDRDLVLPPTYFRYMPLFDEVLADLDRATGGGLGLRLLAAPLKTLAALTGLARYGKNNLAYVEGFGSFIQLVGLASDARLSGSDPAGGGGLYPAFAALDECRTCRACLKSCPTRAIGGDRFLLHGERCLTGLSETEGPLPDSYGKLRRRCLIGCLACQERCPANKGRVRFERLAVRFSAEETAYLAGERGDGLPSAGLVDKVRSLACTDLRISDRGPEPILRRNLRAALNAG
jgi:epoxyqueuosine reductase